MADEITITAKCAECQIQASIMWHAVEYEHSDDWKSTVDELGKAGWTYRSSTTGQMFILCPTCAGKFLPGARRE